MANADRIIELLHEAKARPAGAEREQFLAGACRDDPALKEQIVSLLEADADDGGSFLKRTLFIPPTAPVTEKPGDRIGRYKLLEQIGEGGCGVVYMAEQEEPVRRRVALKVIKLGMDTKQVIARFEAERQTLAMMDHPNIAKIFDAGITDTPLPASGHPLPSSDEGRGQGEGSPPAARSSSLVTSAGRPFFVMELVRGIKITDYCDQNNLPTNERLELFIQVCQAIQHAHQKGIIHRDIKPSNILVTLHDDVAVPKVIDFGIAKATIGQLTDKTVFTAFAQFVGTPAYMSPEQAQMSGLDIDTRADIYSLGVLLYELLTGNTPFDAKELLAAGMDEMRRKIREDEPAKPSTCLSTMQAMALTTVARRRHVEPPRLIHLIRGDLDWLVMKCLEKDRTRRYETANGLAMDIQRHLSNEPVVARPPTNLYRFQKLVRRNKLAFAAASAVAVALVVGLGISTWMFFREKEARQRASTEAAKSQEVAHFLKDMLEGVGPSVALGRDTTMLREIVDKTAERLNDLKAQPAVEADLRAELGRVYFDLGEYTNAAAMHQKALELRRKLLGSEHLDTAASLSDLGRVLDKRGNYQEAESLRREALATRKKLLGNEHPDVATSLDDLALTLREQGERTRTENESLSRGALAMRRKLLGNEHPDVAVSLDHLGMFLWDQRKPELYPEAESLQREGLAIRRKLFGSEHPDVAWSLDHLGLALRSQSKYAEAEAVTREALAMRRKLLGNGHPEVATSLHNLASVLSAENNLAEAETLYREELTMRKKLLGNEHARVGDSFLSLGWVLANQGRHAEAEAVLREGVAIRRKVLGNDDSEVAENISFLAVQLSEQGKLAEAESLFRESVVVLEKKTPDDWQTFNARSTLGGSLLGQKKYTEAEPLLLSGYEGMKQREDKIPAGSKRHVKKTLQRLVQLYEVTGQSEKAAEWNRKLAEFDKAEAEKKIAAPKP